MSSRSLHVQSNRGIAFFGNYLPRRCGIATFTHDLAETVARQAGADQPVIVAAMNDVVGGYAYPNRVKFELRQDQLADYSRAADFLNFSNVDVVNLQHEYGIYGGERGSNVLAFLKSLNRPSVVTCHTVLSKPARLEREILREIAANTNKLVVMSEQAFSFLEDGYGIPREKIACIPHGIHETPFIDPSFYKDKFGVEGRKVILTFGLLNRAKGIEFMVEAMSKIVKFHPKTSYVVLGETHPAQIRKEGEAYRLSLQRRVRELGLEEHVLFYPRFVALDELLEYLGATDIFVTPYLFVEQITSGALSYAMGTGKAVVSTPYWHANELLADDRGIIVPVSDSPALADAVLALLDDEVRLNAMRKRAYLHCKTMGWANVAKSYLRLFDEVRSGASPQWTVASSLRSPIAATSFPLPKLDHVLRLTDDTGPAVYARYAIPDRNSGYSLDATAATLIASCKFYHVQNDTDALGLLETCLALFQTLIGDNDGMHVAAGLDYARRKQGIASEESLGKAIWALGYLVWQGPGHLTAISSDLLHQVLPQAAMKSARGSAYSMLGASNYLQAFPGAAAFRRFVKIHAEILTEFVATPNWYRKFGAPDWPVAVQSMCVVSELLDDDALRVHARQLVTQMRAITVDGTIFSSNADGAEAEELPIITATFIEAIAAAYSSARDAELLISIRRAVDWLLGENKAGAAIYNFTTGGCHDALTSAAINRNQGTEATVYCLLAFLSLNQISWMG